MRIYALLWTLLTPIVAIVAAIHPRLRGAWAERLALRPPPVEPGALWIHGASVGEGRAAEALIAALRRQLGADRPVFLRTAFTDTGLACARGHDALAALPLDRPAAMARFVSRLRPRALVLIEAELWPGLLRACEENGVPVIVAGARPGRGTERLRRRLPGLFVPEPVRAWLAVDETAAAGLRRWGLHAVEVVGDIKADAPKIAPPLRFLRPTLVAGSTRDGDEAALLAAWPRDLQLVLAPRHRERFDAVAALLEPRGLRWARRSALDRDVDPALDVLLLDSVGELAGCYEAAAVAFVGGTFDPAIGGHSPSEALASGVPVVHGPEIRANAAAFVPDRCVQAATVAELAAAIVAARALGRTRETRGEAADRAAARIAALMLPTPPPERPYRPSLAPLAALWRARPRPRGGARCPIPSVAVGNIASGGTGKTRVVRWLLEALRDARPAVVSRGYGRAGGTGVRVATRTDAAWLGDELAMLHAAGFTVVSSPDRVAGVNEAARLGAGVVILDDAMQQTQVQPDLLIAVVDARHPLAGGVLPMGEAREGPEALSRAQIVCVFGDAEPEPLRPYRRGPLVLADTEPLGWTGQDERTADAFSGQQALAFAGIARPGRFLEQLVALDVRLTAWRTFPDHHRFTAAERAQLRALADGRPLLTTEKDLVRLPSDFPCHALRLGLRLRAGEDALRAALQAVIR